MKKQYWKKMGSKIVHNEFKFYNRNGLHTTICGLLLSDSNLLPQKGIDYGQKKCKICFRTAKNITCG